MDPDETWHAGRPWPLPHCARWGPSFPPQNGGQSPPIFGPFLLWPDGWMHQDATWYSGRPRPRQLCFRWGPSSLSTKRRQSPQFSAHVYCGQTAGWIKMPLGTEVCLGPGNTVLDGDPAPPTKRAQPPNFWRVYCGETALCIRIPLGTEVHCVRWGPNAPALKGHSPPPIFSQCPLWPNGWMD